ncbi:MAG: NAD-dependent epimerase/dehydratase family protein, partial [Chloroflexi bacterium]|nr:NAD-dependent epimerase/dehydratase family protein [Chloroflexota bacterium]
PAMTEGTLIDYTVRPLMGIPMPWRTRIEAIEPPLRFRDVQVRGPYRRWEHSHTLTPIAGGTRIDDRIDYELPFGPVGEIAHRMIVRRELERIFRYRARAIESIFEPAAIGIEPRTVVVAGGSGFVGGAIARELRRRGDRVIVLSSRGEGSRGSLPDDIEIRRADVRDPASLAGLLGGADALVIALAFKNSPMENPRRGQTFMEVDAAGTENLVAAARSAGVQRLVYLSGAGAAADAKKHWFRAKWRAEDAVRGSTIPATIIRPTWIYGPDDVSLNRFIGFARSLPVVPMTNFGRQRLAPVFIDDVANLAADSMRDDAAAGRAFEIGGPDTLTMREIITAAIAQDDHRRPIVPGPAPLIKVGAWPLQFLPAPPLTPDAVDFINQPATVDNAPLLDAMPRRLTPLAEGLATYLGTPEPNTTLAFERQAEAA